jgi:hypothetical protein
MPTTTNLTPAEIERLDAIRAPLVAELAKLPPAQAIYFMGFIFGQIFAKLTSRGCDNVDEAFAYAVQAGIRSAMGAIEQNASAGQPFVH